MESRESAHVAYWGLCEGGFGRRLGVGAAAAPFPAWHPVRFAGRREGIKKRKKKKGAEAARRAADEVLQERGRPPAVVPRVRVDKVKCGDKMYCYY